MAEVVPGSELVLIAAAGHRPWVEAPADTAEPVRALFSRIELS
ncbi:hypothetical protein BH24ACT4_BH24ACT4_26760 [soil metagenome]